VIRFLAILAIACLAGGFALVLTGAGLILGILLIILGLVAGAVCGAIAAVRNVRDSVREWRSLFSGGGPDSVRVVRVEPPQGWLLDRDARVTLEVQGRDGLTKQVEKGLPIPIPQALMWRLAGRVPTPVGRLSDARDLNVQVYRKRGATKAE